MKRDPPLWEDWRPSSPCCGRRRCRTCASMLTVSNGSSSGHAADEPMVTLSLTEDVYLRSYNGARLELGIPLPPMER